MKCSKYEKVAFILTALGFIGLGLLIAAGV